MGLNHDSVDGLVAALEGEEDVGARPRGAHELEPKPQEGCGHAAFDEAFQEAQEIYKVVARAVCRWGARGAPGDFSAGELTTNEYAAMGLAARRLVTALRRVAL